MHIYLSSSQARRSKAGITAWRRGRLAGLLLCLAAWLLPAGARAQEVIVHPKEYPGALRNPLMGFATGLWPNNERYDWGTLARDNIPWNVLENREGDGLDKIRAVCAARWKEAAAHNVKVVPRVYLRWSAENETYWPADMITGDYSSPQFQRRLVRLIHRLGQAWDGDPRVAYVQMGLIGRWGEHHTPSVSPALQKLMGDAFTEAFPHKRVLVRHPWDFAGYKFGIYWDSFAHADQDYHAQGILKLGPRWQIAPMGGETAYDWGHYKVQPGAGPDDTLADPGHHAYLIDMIRQLHCSHLGWVGDYDRKNAEARAGAVEVQKAFGYRFVPEEARFPARLTPGRAFSVTLAVRNTGSTPFYYAWPVRLFLLDARTRRPVWGADWAGLDIREWLPGDFWQPPAQSYARPPLLYWAAGRFTAPSRLPAGRYLLAVAICDPAGNRPSARFAAAEYVRGGFLPLGDVGLGAAPPEAAPAPVWDDPAQDDTLHYDTPNYDTPSHDTPNIDSHAH